jgi:hypothetical protein
MMLDIGLFPIPIDFRNFHLCLRCIFT